MGHDFDALRLQGVLETLYRGWNVDRKRILLTGLSDGGTYALARAVDEDTPFSAYAVVSGILPPFDLRHVKDRRIYWVHGAKDWMFPLRRAKTGEKELAAAGADVTLKSSPTCITPIRGSRTTVYSPGSTRRSRYNSHHAVFLELLMKRAAGNPETPGGLALVSARLLKGPQDGRLFNFLERPRLLNITTIRPVVPTGFPGGGEDKGLVQIIGPGKNDGPFDRIHQLTDVPGPIMAEEAVHRLGSEPLDVLPVLRGEDLEEMLGEERDVLAAFAQGGQVGS